MSQLLCVAPAAFKLFSPLNLKRMMCSFGFFGVQFGYTFNYAIKISLSGFVGFLYCLFVLLFVWFWCVVGFFVLPHVFSSYYLLTSSTIWANRSTVQNEGQGAKQALTADLSTKGSNIHFYLTVVWNKDHSKATGEPLLSVYPFVYLPDENHFDCLYMLSSQNWSLILSLVYCKRDSAQLKPCASPASWHGPSIFFFLLLCLMHPFIDSVFWLDLIEAA